MGTHDIDVEPVSSAELEASTRSILQEIQKYDPATGIEIVANVLIRMGFSLDDSLIADSESGLLDSIRAAKESGGETLATALATQGLVMLSWVGNIEDHESK